MIPVYNSEATLPALTERLAVALPAVADRFEVVLVNDGSRDDSWEAICQAARKHAWARVGHRRTCQTHEPAQGEMPTKDGVEDPSLE